ncbi:LysE family translocator [Psychromonas sp. Urea-02u-13]|uniref:LysE family translocator n=1 Tax=Psychromonas sp. Urea-02u-13 TaxID=2058326 RepID=UPI000C3380A3|nr:LysE family translocator [Psychromonas sp. Urea-02u-13]PKG37251.1 lysine transporter LysE [Psychromonas sp. Urea-02u-13]
MLSLYITYTISIALLISSPGPVIALVISDSKHGWPTGTIWGGAISAILLLACSLLVIHFALVIDETLLDWGRVVGGLYLGYLGVSILLSKQQVTTTTSHHHDCFWRTMKVGLSNPKDILFFLAFLPSFIVTGQSFMDQSMTFLAIWVVVDMLIMLAYAGIAKKLLVYSACQKVLFYLPGIFMSLVGGISLYLGAVNLL